MLKKIKQTLGMDGDGNELIGSIATFAGEYAPRGYIPCDGRLLPIKDHEALYGIISTRYGGDGVTTFAVPDLRPVIKDAPDTGKPRRVDWRELGLPRQLICWQGLYPSRS